MLRLLNRRRVGSEGLSRRILNSRWPKSSLTRQNYPCQGNREQTPNCCREAATALEAFYRSLPAQIEQLASAESAATGEADQLLRLVDARDAGAIAGNHNMPSRVVWLPTPKGDLTLDRFDSSLELDGKSWVTFPVTLRAVGDLGSGVAFAAVYKKEELEVRYDGSMPVDPGASNQIRLDRDNTRTIKLDVKPRTATPGTFKLGVIFSADGHEKRRADVQCVYKLELPNVVDLVIARETSAKDDPFIKEDAKSRTWILKPYSNGQTIYKTSLRNQSGKPKKVNVDLFSTSGLPKDTKPVNEQGEVFSTFKRTLIATAQAVDLPATASEVQLSLALPPDRRPCPKSLKRERSNRRRRNRRQLLLKTHCSASFTKSVLSRPGGNASICRQQRPVSISSRRSVTKTVLSPSR